MQAGHVGLALSAPRSASGGGAPPAAKVSAIANSGYMDGWVGTWVGGTPPALDPDNNPANDNILRAGFDTTGAATTYNDTVTWMRRLRDPWQGAEVLAADKVTASTVIYADDRIAGTIPGGSMSSPKSVCKWLLADMVLTAGVIHHELAVFHRNARDGKQVACVVFTATSATVPGVTLTQIVLNSTVSTSRANDQAAVLAYQCDLDASAYPDDTVWILNAKVYPWFGVNSSVADSSSGTAGARGFVPQRFWKHAARAANPPLGYVTATGVDGTGVISTNPATAKANGFQTLKGLIEAMRTTYSGVTGGIVDGCRARISNVSAGLAASTASATYTAGKAAFVVEGDPAETKASNVYAWAAANVSFRTGYTRFEGNLTIVRTSTNYFQAVDGLILGGPAGAPDFNITSGDGSLTNSSAVGTYVEGLNCTGIGSSTFGANATLNDIRLLRGVVSVGGNFELQCLVGNKISTASTTALSAARSSGMIVAFNRFPKITGTFFGISFVGTLDGGVNMQNLFEFTGTNPTGGITWRPSGDGSTTNCFNLIQGNNTYAGANDCGRANLLYDETVGTFRSHTLCADFGSGHVALNHKGDRFIYGPPNNATVEAASHTGAFSIVYGVDWYDVSTQYCSADGGILNGPFSVICAGLNASIGTAKFTVGGLPPNDPKFVAPACTTTTNGTSYSPGAGDGDYHLQASSPWRNTQKRVVLPFDLDGVARNSNLSSRGALAA